MKMIGELEQLVPVEDLAASGLERGDVVTLNASQVRPVAHRASAHVRTVAQAGR
jgi:hypothetical protein